MSHDGSHGANPNTEQANIVFIMADDLGYADVSCYGRRDYTTPNIDRLASEGMKFTQAYANSAVCSPTRDGADHRALSVPPAGRARGADQSPESEGRSACRPSHPTLPSLLKKAGYGTDAGRQMAPRLSAGLRPAQERLRPVLRHLRRRRRLFRSRQQVARRRLYEQEVPVERHGYMTDLLGDRAVQTIEGYARSKAAVLPQPAFHRAALAVGGPDDEAESKRDQRATSRHYDGGSQKTYAAMVQSMDANIGRVLAGARRAGTRQQHHRRLHQRQRRRAVLRHLAVHRHEGRAARRRPARSGDRALAGTGAGGTGVRAGHDLDGLAADAAGGRRRGPDPAYPPDGENLLPALPAARRRIRASCSGATRPAGSAPCATATGNISGSPATSSCSTWSRTRASAPI